MSRNNAVAETLEARFRLITDLYRMLGRTTDAMWWERIFHYARLFVEEPTLRELGLELDVRIAQREHPIREAEAKHRETLETMRAALLTHYERLLGEDIPGTAGGMHVSLKEARFPASIGELHEASGLLERAAPQRFDAAAFWHGHADALTSSDDVGTTNALLAVAEPWRIWPLLADVANAPDHVSEATPNVHRWLIAQDLLGKLNLARHAYQPTELLRVGDIQFQLDAFHGWVIGQLRYRRIRGDALRRYKQYVEVFRGDWVLSVIGENEPGTNKDERRLRDDLALFLLHEGFRIYVEPLEGGSRPDIIAEYDTAVDLAIEVKVVRNDRPAKIKERLRHGVDQALHYARRSHLPEGFLVVFWSAERNHNVVELKCADCTIRILIIDLRRDPSKWKAVKSVNISSWEGFV